MTGVQAARLMGIANLWFAVKRSVDNMSRRIIHCCLDISGGIKNAKQLRGCITVDGKTLTTTDEVKSFLYSQLDMGRKVLPVCECDNFDYQRGCMGHDVEDENQ